MVVTIHTTIPYTTPHHTSLLFVGPFLFLLLRYICPFLSHRFTTSLLERWFDTIRFPLSLPVITLSLHCSGTTFTLIHDLSLRWTLHVTLRCSRCVRLPFPIYIPLDFYRGTCDYCVVICLPVTFVCVLTLFVVPTHLLPALLRSPALLRFLWIGRLRWITLLRLVATLLCPTTFSSHAHPTPLLPATATPLLIYVRSRWLYRWCSRAHATTRVLVYFTLLLPARTRCTRGYVHSHVTHRTPRTHTFTAFPARTHTPRTLVLPTPLRLTCTVRFHLPTPAPLLPRSTAHTAHLRTTGWIAFYRSIVLHVRRVVGSRSFPRFYLHFHSPDSLVTTFFRSTFGLPLLCYITPIIDTFTIRFPVVITLLLIVDPHSHCCCS